MFEVGCATSVLRESRNSMNPLPEKPDPGRESDASAPLPRKPRTHTPRPDALSCETFEFISAVDEYKRRHMRSFLNDEEVIDILLSLGYALESARELPDSVTAEEIEAFITAREKYRTEEGRLFPTWSEVFQLLIDLGYQRREGSAA